MVFSYNETAVDLYCNGKFVRSDYINRIIDGTSFDLVLGRLANNDLQYFIGTMDEFHIWNRSLSSSEINAMYNISRTKYPIVMQTRMGNYYDEGDENAIFL